MEPKLYHTCLSYALSLTRGNLFSSQRCASLEKLKFHQNCVFCKTWVQKSFLLTKKITQTEKCFHQEISIELKLCHTCKFLLLYLLCIRYFGNYILQL